jgi:hypothetical protein
MKKLLLASVAALLVLTTVSALAAPTLSPTDPLIGDWCLVPKKKDTYKRGSCGDVTIYRDGPRWSESGCTFIDIKRIPNGIDALMSCPGEPDSKSMWVERSTYQIVNGRLQVKTILTETAEWVDTYCVTVNKTPAGYLNLREGPGMAFRVKAKLNIFTHLKVDAQNDDWAHVTHVEEAGEWFRTDGWVYTKYVEPLPDAVLKQPCLAEPTAQ